MQPSVWMCLPYGKVNQGSLRRHGADDSKCKSGHGSLLPYSSTFSCSQVWGKVTWLPWLPISRRQNDPRWQLRILVGMYDLCNKIDWEQTRVLENGTTVTTGCEVKPFIWKMLLVLVLLSIGGQVMKPRVNSYTVPCPLCFKNPPYVFGFWKISVTLRATWLSDNRLCFQNALMFPRFLEYSEALL